MKKTLTCIVCPRGCTLCADMDGGIVTVTGHGCNRGVTYAQSECIHPTRTITSTVRVTNRTDTMASVKTAAPIPKEHIGDAMEIIRRTTVLAPISVGDVIIPDLFGTALVATGDVV